MKAEGSFTSSTGESRPVSGCLCPHSGRLWVFTPFNLSVFLNEFDPIYTGDAAFNEISILSETQCDFNIDYSAGNPDTFGNKYVIGGNAAFSSELSGGGGSGTSVSGIRYEKVQLHVEIIEARPDNLTQTGVIELAATAYQEPNPSNCILSKLLRKYCT